MHSRPTIGSTVHSRPLNSLEHCIHNHDDKYPARPGFEPGTSRLQAPVDTNEPSGPANKNGIAFLNSDQTPYQLCRSTTLRQLLLKQLQGQFPESELGEDSFCDDVGTAD